jgi:hypothetical protein
VASALRDYLKGRPAGAPFWPGNWWKKGAEMLRIDLDAVGIPYAVDGPDGPLYADFHALRHSYIALLEKSAATLKEAMELARHGDPKLTMAVYGRAQLHDLGRTVGRLPVLMAGPTAEPQAATGTDGAAGDSGRPRLHGACTDSGSVRDSGGLSGTSAGGEAESAIGRKPLTLQGVGADGDSEGLPDSSSPVVTLLELLGKKSRARFRR